MVRISDSKFRIALKVAIEQMIDDDIIDTYKISDDEIPAMSDKVHRRILRKLQRRCNTTATTWRSSLRRVAALFLIAGTVLFATAMSIEPVRAAFINEIVTWYNKYIGVLFLVEDTVPGTIEQEYPPTNLPSGWTAELVSRDEANIFYIITNSHGGEIYYQQTVITDSELWLDNRSHNEERLVLKNGKVSTVRSYDDGVIDLYLQDGYIFLISGESKYRDEIVAIANGIKAK